MMDHRAQRVRELLEHVNPNLRGVLRGAAEALKHLVREGVIEDGWELLNEFTARSSLHTKGDARTAWCDGYSIYGISEIEEQKRDEFIDLLLTPASPYYVDSLPQDEVPQYPQALEARRENESSDTTIGSNKSTEMRKYRDKLFGIIEDKCHSAMYAVGVLRREYDSVQKDIQIFSKEKLKTMKWLMEREKDEAEKLDKNRSLLRKEIDKILGGTN